MKVDDFGFITYVRKFEENSLLIKILSSENGLISGYMKHVKKDKGNYSVGNLVKFNWSAKNADQLGTLKMELVKSYLSNFIGSRFYLHLMDNMNSLINNLLLEGFVDDTVFRQMEVIFDLVNQDAEKFLIVREYLIFENILLNVVGTGIIFDEEEEVGNLCFISPKTGLAVCLEKGNPYKDRLLVFPNIFKSDRFEKIDIFEAFTVLDFFLKKHLESSAKYKLLAISRENLLNNL